MKLSDSPATLLEGFEAAEKNYDKMRGWKRALTLYCRKRSVENGSTPSRVKAGIKMVLRKNGYDCSKI